MIKQISLEETYPIRTEVLRRGIINPKIEFYKDNDSQTFHLGKYINENLVGIVSYCANTLQFNSKKHRLKFLPKMVNKNMFQLRGMAVLDDFQRQGIGMELCAFGEVILKQRNADYLWCNARIGAIPFYKHQKFEILSDRFFINQAGDHFVMGKNL